MSPIATGFVISSKAIIVLRGHPQSITKIGASIGDQVAAAALSFRPEAVSAPGMTALAKATVGVATCTDPALGPIEVVGSTAFGTPIDVASSAVLAPFGGGAVSSIASRIHQALLQELRDRSRGVDWDATSDLPAGWEAADSAPHELRTMHVVPEPAPGAWLPMRGPDPTDVKCSARELERVIDEFAYGVVVISLDGSILTANHAAWREILAGRALREESQILRTRIAEEGRKLREAVMMVRDGKRSLVAVRASEGSPLTVAAVPLAGQAGEPARAALTFARTSVCESPMLSLFARNHDLTATEMEVLGLLCQGYTGPEVAKRLNVAVSTIRTHVRSLCAKTESGSVRELVNRLALLPPVGLGVRASPGYRPREESRSLRPTTS